MCYDINSHNSAYLLNYLISSLTSHLVIIDVTSLYSNIPHSDGIKACEHFLNLNPEGRGIFTESVSDLISTVLTKNHFQLNGDNYLQTMGCAMATKMAPSYASLFTGKFKKKYIKSVSSVSPCLA